MDRILVVEEVSLTGDRARLREAVENLASNALRHAEPGGVAFLIELPL